MQAAPPRPEMIVLGIDPGTATTGYAVVADPGNGQLRLIEHGAITTSPKDELGSRLRTIYLGVADVVGRHAPGEMAVERLFFSRNASSALAVGHARGVAILAAALLQLPIREYTP